MTVTPVVCSARARRYVSHPHRRLACPAVLSLPAHSHAARPQPATCAQSRPRDDPGVPRPRGMRAGGRQTALPVHALQPPPPCVLSPDPVTTPGRPVPGGCVRGGRQTALPRRAAGCVPPRPSRRRAAATISTHTQRALPRCRAGRPPARPGARAGRPGAPARPTPRGRRADTRTSVATQARTGRRATWTAHGDYLAVLSSTRTSCQRHRRVRVAPDTAPGRIIGHRPRGTCR